MAFFKKKKESDVKEFWQNLETELNTPILGHILVRHILESNVTPLWGLLYSTEEALYFRTFASENWFSLILSHSRVEKGRPKEETMRFAVERIQQFAVQPEKNRLLRLLNPPAMLVLCWHSSEENQEKKMIFETDNDALAFVRTLSLEEKITTPHS